MPKKPLIKVIFICLILSLPGALWSYSTTNVPVDDPVYRDIDKLIAVGLAPSDIIYGQRPWSRREIGRIISKSVSNRKKISKKKEGEPYWPYIDGILKRLEKEYKSEIEGKTTEVVPLDQVQLDYTILDSPYRAVPANIGLGSIDAQINPLVAYREGRHYADGNTLGLETTHRAKLSKYFSLYARPRLEFLSPWNGSNAGGPILQQGYGKFAYKNFEIEAGRDSVIWGQNEHGGFLLSNNARPLDALKAGTISPLYLPFFLRYLGPVTFQTFFATMGPERDFPHSILSGYRFGFKPVTFVELGLSHAILMGGNGANDPSFWEAIGEYSGGLSAVLSNTRGQSTFTNRIFSADGRFTLPFLRNSIFYAEVGFDDTNREWDILFEDDGMYLAGLYTPLLSRSGALDLQLEYSHVSGITYRHNQYTSGWTLNQKILGSESGPDGDKFLARLGWDIPSNAKLFSSFNFETRDSDLLATRMDGPNIVDIFRNQNNPEEKRWRWTEEIQWKIHDKTHLNLQAGMEYVQNFNFDTSDQQSNFFGNLCLIFQNF